MHSVKFSIVLLALAVKICCGCISVRHSDSDKSSELVQAVVKIITRCYANQGNAVVIAGRVPEVLLRTLSESVIPVASIDDTSAEVYNSKWPSPHPYRLHVFVVTSSSRKQYDNIMRVIRRSGWWNPMAHYLIVNWSSVASDGCTDSATYLYKAWDHNMINAKMICLNRTKKVEIRAYNRYKSEAPKPWVLDKVYTGKHFHPFTVFTREFKDADEVCENLDFETTKKLAGFPLHVHHRTAPMKKRNFKRMGSMAIYAATENNIFDNLFLAMGVTPIYQEYTSGFKDYSDNKHLIKVAYMPVYDPIYLGSESYPIHRDGLAVMTQFRGHLTQLEKLLSVTDMSSRIGVNVVLIVTVLFFKFFMRQSLMSAFLNVVRIVCNTGFMHVPQRTSIRLYVSSVLMLAVVIHGIYSGVWAALLTQQVPIPDVITKQDLADTGYKIYIPYYLATFFNEPVFRGRVTKIEGTNCTKYVLEDPLAACVSYPSTLKDEADHFKLHLAPEYMAWYPLVFCLPTQSHLEDRINFILQTLLEADIIEPLRVRGQDAKLSDFEFDEEVKANQVVKVMTMGELEFAFVILGIGLSIATVVLTAEIAIHRYRSRIRTTRVQILN